MAEFVPPSKVRDRIKRLQRRADWLRSQSDSTPDHTDISYIRSELSALDWAIEVLKEVSNAKE